MATTWMSTILGYGDAVSNAVMRIQDAAERALPHALQHKDIPGHLATTAGATVVGGPWAGAAVGISSMLGTVAREYFQFRTMQYQLRLQREMLIAKVLIQIITLLAMLIVLAVFRRTICALLGRLDVNEFLRLVRFYASRNCPSCSVLDVGAGAGTDSSAGTDAGTVSENTSTITLGT